MVPVLQVPKCQLELAERILTDHSWRRYTKRHLSCVSLVPPAQLNVMESRPVARVAQVLWDPLS